MSANPPAPPLPPLRFVPTRVVLPPEELGVVLNAGQLLRETQARQAAADEEAARARADGRKSGYAAGFADGRRAAFDGFRRDLAKVQEQLALSERDLAGILIAALERMLGELGERDLARRCVAAALQDAADEIWAVVRVPPDDLTAVRSDLAGHFGGHVKPLIRSVEADPLLRPGELVVETPRGSMHVGVKQQVARLGTELARLETTP